MYVSQTIPGSGAMEQLCDDLRQFAIQVRQLGYSRDRGRGGAGVRGSQ